MEIGSTDDVPITPKWGVEFLDLNLVKGIKGQHGSKTKGARHVWQLATHELRSDGPAQSPLRPTHRKARERGKKDGKTGEKRGEKL